MLSRPLRRALARRARPARAPSAPLSAAPQSAEPADECPFPDLPATAQRRLVIDGELRDAVSGRSFVTTNPGNGRELCTVAEAGSADVDLAVAAAHRALREGPWGSTVTPRERGAALCRLADLVDANAEELAALESLDNGKGLNLSANVDVPVCAMMLRYWAGWADKLAGKQVPMGQDFLCYTRHEPVGVVGAIVPWNLPLIAAAAKLGPALTCGNTVVLKAAEQTPLTALRLGELALEAGFPAGVVNVLSGFGEGAGSSLVAHPAVNKITFTGSVEVGKHVQRSAADTLKRVTLELGGKNPSIVFDDADLDSALESVHNGLFWNKAEACAAGTRIFVQDGVYDEFVERATQKAREWRVGNPFHPDTCQGAQVSEEQFDKIMDYIRVGQEEGAELVAGGARVGTRGYYVQPTVFTGIRDDMRIFTEEIFGPVMTLARFSTLDEVVRRANASDFGLAAGVFTRDIVKGHEVAARLQAGMVFWNCYHAVDVAAPFGGFKQSGIGREGGEYGLQPYLETKNVVLKVTK